MLKSASSKTRLNKARLGFERITFTGLILKETTSEVITHRCFDLCSSNKSKMLMKPDTVFKLFVHNQVISLMYWGPL